ncbi:p-hydroxyphenylacetate 3-hydroxylase reductase component [Oceanospirillum sp.]|uniref:p-hydroxyphenylacetate 3-hydroxylase reductase component n=1 Tax=Oceanospirillum sp. TaxID=2021254 RepID=UPI003A8FF7BB
MTTAFDPKAFRRALGNFATGVTVITATAKDGQQAGVTANSFNSVSLDPPLVLWSIMKNSGSVEIFDNASHFAVNVLAADQIDISNHFARPSDDKFSSIDYEKGLGDAPLLSDCAARFQCANYEKVDGGDHWILIGKVEAFDDYGRAPLLYHGGTYSAVVPHMGAAQKKADVDAAAAEQADADREKMLDNNLYYQMLSAVKRYQRGYWPMQQASGLRVAEAHLLMVLKDLGSVSFSAMVDYLLMPDQDLAPSVEKLKRKAWINVQDEQLTLTEEGTHQAEAYWQLSEDYQEKVFGDLTDEELAVFRKVLKKI